MGLKLKMRQRESELTAESQHERIVRIAIDIAQSRRIFSDADIDEETDRAVKIYVRLSLDSGPLFVTGWSK